MANKILTANDVLAALELYGSMPAATILRGLTGYGLVVNQKDEEAVDPVADSKGIWKPMYFFISGGERRGRKTLAAAHVKSAVEEFKRSPLLAVLRSTSGRGLRLDDAAGMVELANTQDAFASVMFELSHFGGRSIVPALTVTLGKLSLADIEWRGGFSYNAPGGKPARVGESLELTRFLIPDDYASEESFARVWEDLEREAMRITLVTTDGTLPNMRGENRGDIRGFLTQELTALVPGARVEEEWRFKYRVRNDKMVEVQKELRPDDVTAERDFTATLEAFRKECQRVFTLYCQPLSENQKKILGKPAEKVYGIVKTPKLDWQQRVGESGAMSFHPDAPKYQNAVFPADGWRPKIVNGDRVLCVRKGRGFTGYPAPPVYLERLAQKDGHTAVRQLVRIEFDGSEKVVRDAEEIPLREYQKLSESTYWSPQLEHAEGAWWVIETINHQWQTVREQVVDAYETDVNGKRIATVQERIVESVPCPAQRRCKPTRVFVEPRGYGGRDPHEQEYWPLNPTKNVYGYRVQAEWRDKDEALKKVSLEAPDKQWGAFKWEEIPEELRTAYLKWIEEAWPVCACGEIRYERAKAAQCYYCCHYRNCERCGKRSHFGEEQIAKMMQAAEPFHCSTCEEWVAVIACAVVVMPEHRSKLAGEARMLLAGKIEEDELAARKFLGDLVTSRIPSSYERSDKLNHADVAMTAIETADAYWASGFKKDQLERVAALESQTQAEVVVTLAMILSPSRWRRLEKEPENAPELKESNFAYLIQQLDSSKNMLAYLMLESDAVREAAIAAARAAKDRAAAEAKRKEEEEERKRQREEERRVAEKAKRRAKEEQFAETGVLADEASTGFNSFAAALAAAKQKKQKR